MATYVNDLRLKEIATGDESGTWGTSTNTNLELIGEAFSVGTEALSDASTGTITVQDGTSDAARSMNMKLSGSLSQACTVTLAPNTLSKVWCIENNAGDANVYPTGVAGTTALGSVGIICDNNIAVTLDQATSGLGSLTATGTAAVVLEGLAGTGEITQLLVWGLVDTDQDPEWSGVSTSQTPSWSAVSTSQDPEWSAVSTSQTPSWSGVSTNQDPDWKEVA